MSHAWTWTDALGVSSQLSTRPPASADAAETRLLDYQGAADLLNVSTKHVGRMVAAGQLPHVRLGGRVLFLLDDLITEIHRNRIAGTGSQP